MMFCLLLRWIQVRRTTRFSRWLSNKSVSSSRKTINFGELVFLHGLRHPCIVRFVDMQVSEKVSAMRELIDSHADSMRGSAMIVVTPNRIRIRSVDN